MPQIGLSSTTDRAIRKSVAPSFENTCSRSNKGVPEWRCGLYKHFALQRCCTEIDVGETSRVTGHREDVVRRGNVGLERGANSKREEAVM